MAKFDEMPKEWRDIINDYGNHVVTCFLDQGINRPNAIRHIVEAVLDEFSPTRGTSSSQGPGARRARLMTESHEQKGGYEA